MPVYQKNLKPYSRELRSNMTICEQKLWNKIRRKSLGVQFYRQQPIGNYIVDFYCANPKIVIEIDGSQHYSPKHREKDITRDQYLIELNIKVLRFNNLSILKNLDEVLQTIADTIEQLLINPPVRIAHDPLFQSG